MTPNRQPYTKSNYQLHKISTYKGFFFFFFPFRINIYVICILQSSVCVNSQILNLRSPFLSKQFHNIDLLTRHDVPRAYRTSSTSLVLVGEGIINTLMLDIMLFSRFNGCELLLLLPQLNSLKKVVQLGTVSYSEETLLFSEFLTSKVSNSLGCKTQKRITQTLAFSFKKSSSQLLLK